jgi:cobalt/nickel transport system permease protein
VILTALLLQGLFFGYGGYTCLGVNTFNMAFPAVLCFLCFSYLVNITARRELLFVFGFLCGFISVALSASLVFLELCLSGPGFKSVSFLVLTSHIPVMFAEGIITGCAAVFIKRVRPDLFKAAERGGFSGADFAE